MEVAVSAVEAGGIIWFRGGLDEADVLGFLAVECTGVVWVVFGEEFALRCGEAICSALFDIFGEVLSDEARLSAGEDRASGVADMLRGGGYLGRNWGEIRQAAMSWPWEVTRRPKREVVSKKIIMIPLPVAVTVQRSSSR